MLVSSLDNQDRSLSFFSLVNIKKAIDGRLEASRTTKWILSKDHSLPTHSLMILSNSSSVTLLVSTTLYSIMPFSEIRPPYPREVIPGLAAYSLGFANGRLS